MFLCRCYFFLCFFLFLHKQKYFFPQISPSILRMLYILIKYFLVLLRTLVMHPWTGLNACRVMFLSVLVALSLCFTAVWPFLSRIKSIEGIFSEWDLCILKDVRIKNMFIWLISPANNRYFSVNSPMRSMYVLPVFFVATFSNE